MKLLYAEDEVEMSEAVADILTFHKYSVDVVADGKTALDYARAEKYDGIILDIMMPGMSGLEVLTQLRKDGNSTPVLLLTAKTAVDDRIQGLDCGADDYLPKPFVMGELLARIRAMLRRRSDYQSEEQTIGDLTLNLSTYELCSGEKKIVLQNLEYRLMETLMLNRSVWLSAEDLLTRVWGYETEADVDTVWVYLSGLRKKIANLGSKVLIRSKRNIGYRMEMPSEEK